MTSHHISSHHMPRWAKGVWSIEPMKDNTLRGGAVRWNQSFRKQRQLILWATPPSADLYKVLAHEF